MAASLQLDQIVRDALITCGKPIHYYMEFLHYALKGFREMQYDSYLNVTSREYTVNANGEVFLPDDYVDYVRIGQKNGQYVIPMEPKYTFNRNENINSDGVQIAYPDIEGTPAAKDATSYEAEYYTEYVNDKGEHEGRHFGHKATQRKSFRVLPEREVILFDVSLIDQKIVLDYISTGQEPSLRTVVHPYASEALERYILYRHFENSKSYGVGQVREAKEEYTQAHRRLRARKNDMSIGSIVRSLRKNNHAGIKI
mgnify:CR=1 FL=1